MLKGLPILYNDKGLLVAGKLPFPTVFGKTKRPLLAGTLENHRDLKSTQKMVDPT